MTFPWCRMTFFEAFAMTHDRDQFAVESRFDFLVNGFVGFREVLTTLGMTDQNVFAANVAQHFQRILSPVKAPFFSEYIFCAPI